MTTGKLQSQPLPPEILENILSRLPVNTLCRFRCVSKCWLSLVSDPRFIKMHFHQSMKKNPKIITSSVGKLFSVDLEAVDATSAIELHFPLPQPVRRIVLVGCCNGLVCFNHGNSIYVWNPATRAHIKFPADPDPPASGSIHLDFGFNPLTGEYKVLRFLREVYGYRETGVIVRTLAENPWRRVETLPFVLDSFTNRAFVNGNLHWLADHGGRSDRALFIACFDFRDEKWRVMQLPDFGDEQKSLKIFVFGGLLSICAYFQYKHCFEIWVMKGYGDEKSWTKQISQTTKTRDHKYVKVQISQTQKTRDHKYMKVLGFRKNDKILVQNIYSRVVLHNLVNDRIRGLDIHDTPVFGEEHSYMESLVSPMDGNIL